MVVVYSTKSFSLNEPLCKDYLGMSSSEELPENNGSRTTIHILAGALKDPRQNWICYGSGLARHAVPVACA